MWFEIEMHGYFKSQLPTREQLEAIEDEDNLLEEVCRHMWSTLEGAEYNDWGHTARMSPKAKQILIDAMMAIQDLVHDERPISEPKALTQVKPLTKEEFEAFKQEWLKSMAEQIPLTVGYGNCPDCDGLLLPLATHIGGTECVCSDCQKPHKVPHVPYGVVPKHTNQLPDEPKYDFGTDYYEGCDKCKHGSGACDEHE